MNQLFFIFDRRFRKEKSTMDCNNYFIIALQVGHFIMALIYGLVGIMINLIKVSQKEK